MTCLDRYLVNSAWSFHYPTSLSCSFPRVCSDHSPICLEFSFGTRFKNLIFHFEKCLLGQDDFFDLMTN
jgi:hypothetical protein